MTDKKLPTIVVCVKTKLGEDILGFYSGESEESAEYEKSILLYRPIRIKEQLYHVPKLGKTITNYVTNLYSPYGSVLVSIPVSQIINRDVASDFFDVFYRKSLGDLITAEELVQEAHVNFWSSQDEDEALANTDSILVKTETEYLQ